MAFNWDEFLLAYDLDAILTQTCTILRDVGTLDKWGGEKHTERTKIAEPRCFFSWWRTISGRSTSHEWADPEARIFYTGGTLVLPSGIDVQEADHIGDVYEGAAIAVHGPFQVNSVQRFESEIQLNLVRPAAE